ncbi:uncharacterized protein si:ch211-130h14.4 isoform X2 [Cheilinus undulatus]|uniref:uncharacterized protein si:ch211-130h14.4 isoform X2 n=1 Tax=Cheilinus undulatus TaxID=241271 RepID=UPI001BD32254|nr:uncharacterized protein si:ch211-130h14.4 isoform X2 [Cheilinus undulatus]
MALNLYSHSSVSDCLTLSPFFFSQRQKKLSFSKLQHNDSFLKSLPKTSYYLIFDLQRQLSEQGLLKTHHNFEEFYSRIDYRRHPSKILKSLEGVRRRMLESRPAADLGTSEKQSCPGEEKRHEDKISTFRLSKQISDSGGSSELVISGIPEEDGCERLFPKMKAPTFATLQPDFMRNFGSKMPILQTLPEIPKKSQRAELHLRQLRQMHDLCLSNMALSQKLTEKETDSVSWQEERGRDPDLMPPGIDSKHGITSRADLPPLCSQKQPRIIQISQRTSPKPSSKTPLSQRCSETSLCACSSKSPDPLCIEDLCQLKNVQVVGHGLTVWNNYVEDLDY